MIRTFEFEDLEPMMKLGEIMHKESSYWALPYDPTSLAYALQTNDNYEAWVYEVDHEIRGMLIAALHPHMYCRVLSASEILLFVHPDHRGGTAAYRMIKEMIQWAGDKGVDEINAGITTGVHPETTAKLYEKAGFRNAGIVLKMRGN